MQMQLHVSKHGADVQAAYFEQKYFATFFLAPEAAGGTAAEPSKGQRRSEHTRSADSRSPRHSPRDISVTEHDAAGPQPHARDEFQASYPKQSDSTSAQHVSKRQSANADDAQAVQCHPGHVSRSSTPDLSPRGDCEADDPPTPRMYKSIVPTAAPSQVSIHQTNKHSSPGIKAESSLLVLHQGHYEHGTGHSSPHRTAHTHAQREASQQAIENLQHSLRHVSWPSCLHCHCM